MLESVGRAGLKEISVLDAALLGIERAPMESAVNAGRISRRRALLPFRLHCFVVTAPKLALREQHEMETNFPSLIDESQLPMMIPCKSRTTRKLY